MGQSTTLSFANPAHPDYPAESGHAKALYRTHQAEVDEAWTAFLYRQLKLTQPK